MSEMLTTHAGGIVFRRSRRSVSYLLVRANKPKDAWVFPKGHIESGEDAEKAALREVHEEAGIVATIVSFIGRLEYDAHYTEMFLMRFRRSVGSKEERECVWANFDDAVKMLEFEESRQLLNFANNEVLSII